MVLREVVVDLGRVGELGSSAAAAGFAACAGSEGGGVAEWQIETRGRARASGATRTVIKVVQSAMKQNESLQQAAASFEAASAAERKRKSEESVNDKLTAMAATIAELVSIQKQLVECQILLLECNKALIDSNKGMIERIKAQAEEVKVLKAKMQDSGSQRTYSEVTADGGSFSGSHSSQMRSTFAGSPQIREERPQAQDD